MIIQKTSKKPRVVIIGAGFAGIEAAKTLVKAAVEVIIIDRNNYHTFIPMLFQVATTIVDPQQVVYPIRRMFRQASNILFLQAEVNTVDFKQQFLTTTEGVKIEYDRLILATGSDSKYLGVTGAPEYALSMRSLTEAITIRNQILSCCEQAIKVKTEEERRQILTFVIVGGGATGVELAGSFIELINRTLKRDYPSLNLPDYAQVILIQSGEQLFKSYPKKLGDFTARWLRRRGVQVYLASKVSEVTAEKVVLDDGTIIMTNTVIWTAGVEAATPETRPTVQTTKQQKVIVKSTLQLAESPQVYAVGDVAKVESRSFFGVAQEAIQQGQTAAKNIIRELNGKSLQDFNYHNKGRLAIIGRHAGVGEIGKFAFKGWLAWFLWLEVHWFYLPGIRNRFGVLFNWIKYYVLGEGTTRLIVPQNTSISKIRNLLK